MIRLAKVIMAIGAIIALLAMCCLDSEGMSGIYAEVISLCGVFAMLFGYALYVLAERRGEYDLMDFHQPDKLDGIETKK